MDARNIQDEIRALVAREQALRASTAPAQDPATRRQELEGLQIQLDQCWDLLRQRQGKIDAGENPDEAQVRPASQVENYRQ
ncbi:DUF2630 family protein [Specibacter cremeus]|uniref:DUF2630 family protein n=1 Tax=Specibacter cremeus TaxID=1629051 RepID=UPI000F77CD88|nr:DUF2630 family protein [Specibacter cremeus]